MGFNDVPVKLMPLLNSNFIAVSARNCTKCPSINYDSTATNRYIRQGTPSTVMNVPLNITDLLQASLTGTIAMDSLCIASAPLHPCVTDTNFSSFLLI